LKARIPDIELTVLRCFLWEAPQRGTSTKATTSCPIVVGADASPPDQRSTFFSIE
jgi:hypothetical protein